MKAQIVIGANAITAYSRLNYKPWFALAEFIDNSTQSYVDNKEALDEQYAKEGESLRVDVSITADYIQISDNSIGMDLETFVRGLEFNNTSHQSLGRSRYGLGMKTAAFWFAKRWTISTGKLGSDKMYKTDFDIDRIKNGDYSYEIIEMPKKPETHFTNIRLDVLNKKLTNTTLKNTERYLSSMYRNDINSKRLDLYWRDKRIEGYDPISQLDSSIGGQRYYKPFEFTVRDRQVSGWVGILERGNTQEAGFSLLQHDRVIIGFPNQYKPDSIFGREGGSNSLVNQRLVGEVVLDGFHVTHTKDGIVWDDDDEQIFGEKLAEVSLEYKRIAQSKRSNSQPVVSEGMSKIAISQLQQRLERDDIANTLQIYTPQDLTELIRGEQSVAKKGQNGKTLMSMKLGEHTIRLVIAHEEFSENDKYMMLDKPGNDLEIIINGQHPIFRLCDNADQLYMFLVLCIYDAVSEYKISLISANVEPVMFRDIKDKLLRLPMSQFEDVQPQE